MGLCRLDKDKGTGQDLLSVACGGWRRQKRPIDCLVGSLQHKSNRMHYWQYTWDFWEEECGGRMVLLYKAQTEEVLQEVSLECQIWDCP